MRNILPVILALLLCCIGAICNGQQITQQTTVTVLNENGSPAVNAIAFRLSKTDLAIRQTVMADSAGRIVFPGNVDFGKEFVKITAFGYKDIDITDGSPSEPLKVVFAPLSVRLDEFVVSVEQNTVQKSDSMWDICKRFCVDENEVRSLNPELKQEPTEGEKIYIFIPLKP